MRAWYAPPIPRVPGTGLVPSIYDTSTGSAQPSATSDSGSLYVCGITPYDATHMGHAATYVAFDLLHRSWRDAGLRTRYVQNVTDVDDPLLERAHAIGVDWQALAERETQLFRDDMTALNVLPPDVYLGATETIPWVVSAVQELIRAGAAYRVPVTDGSLMYPSDGDVYFAVESDHEFGAISGWSRNQMLETFPDRGGDPQRAGKRDPLDPLVWRAARVTEPCWDGDTLGAGRPGWHLECVAIAMRSLDIPFDVNAGGSDLIFPHHEMGASHAHVLAGAAPYARTYSHAGMVGLAGEKMSKSKGNLVLISGLRADGVDPMAIRLAILAHHYRSDWDWSAQVLVDAQERLARWRAVLSGGAAAAAAQRPGPAGPAEPAQLNASTVATATMAALRTHLAEDLNAPGALAVLDQWCQQHPDASPPDRALLRAAMDALYGIAL